MENTIILTQLSTSDFQQLFRETLDAYFAENRIGESEAEADEIGGIDLAVEVTGLAKPTIYGMVSDRTIPHSKKSKKLYFSRKELTDWIKNGRRKTQSEIAAEAENHKPTKNKKAVPATV